MTGGGAPYGPEPGNHHHRHHHHHHRHRRRWWPVRVTPAHGVFAVGAGLCGCAELARAVPMLDATVGWLLPLGLLLLLLLVGFWLVTGRIRRHPFMAAVALLLLVLEGTRLYSDRPVSPQWVRAGDAPHPVGGLRLLYWKINHDNRDPAAIAETILAQKADYVLMEEMSGDAGVAIDARLRRTYPYRSTCRLRCGQAIFSRYPIAEERRWKAGGAPLIWVRTRDSSGQPLVLVLAHIPARHGPAIAAATAAELAGLDRRRMIVAGDFNLPPWTSGLHALDDRLFPLRRRTRGVPTWPAAWQGVRYPFPFQPTDQVYVGPEWGKADLRLIPGVSTGHYPIRIDVGK